MTIRERIGFAIHTEDLYNHYRNVIRELGPRAEVVILATVREPAQLEARLTRDGVQWKRQEAVFAEGWRYRYLVTNHMLSGGGWQPYLPERLGHFNVRFMYALGKAGHNFSAWNELYDVILCHGPYQVEQLASCSALKLEMGYPRYDGFQAQFEDRVAIRQRLGFDSTKPLVLWMPTWQELCSLEAFMPAVKQLSSEYDLLVKPHPLTVTYEPERLKLIQDSGLTYLTDASVDITDLYAAADCVLTDYGGSIFSALYMDRPIVLLDSPEALDHKHTGEQSPDLLARDSLPHLSAEEALLALSSTVADAMEGSAWSAGRRRMRARYFKSHNGSSAVVAADHLRSLDELLVGHPPNRLRRAILVRVRELTRGERSVITYLDPLRNYARSALPPWVLELRRSMRK